MNLLFEYVHGGLCAADCDAVIAVQQPDDDRWMVRVMVRGFKEWDTVVGDLTESEAKTIVRKLFDYGRYMHCP